MLNPHAESTLQMHTLNPHADLLKQNKNWRHSFRTHHTGHQGDTTYRIGLRYQNYSRSIETFINLIEKIEDSFEEKNRRISAEALAKHLLKRWSSSASSKSELIVLNRKFDTSRCSNWPNVEFINYFN